MKQKSLNETKSLFISVQQTHIKYKIVCMVSSMHSYSKRSYSNLLRLIY